MKLNQFFHTKESAEGFLAYYQATRPDWEALLLQGIKRGTKGWFIIYWKKKKKRN